MKKKKRWKVLLTEQQRGVIMLMVERFEGPRTEFQRMDRAIGVIDRDYSLSDKVITTNVGVMMDLPSLSSVEETWELKNEPFKTLKNFLKDQRVNYSRRPATIGRIFMDVLAAFDEAEEVVEEMADES